MEIFRIAKTDHTEIDGLGGLLYPGRWHEKGNRVVYASQHRSLAAFETLVHISSTKLLTNNFVMITIQVPDNASLLTVPDQILEKGWDSCTYLPAIQQYGTQFLKEKKYLLLKAPSAIIKQEFNFILNPLHEQFSFCSVINVNTFQFDERLLV
ncbi:MAG TPA: RES family NAD+ phosphorylase [Bacteroidales bacterium]